MEEPAFLDCPDCKGDGRPFAKDGSRNGNAKCKTCTGTGKVEQTRIGDDDE
jgi:DnaJ-class molecular chaperone